MNNLRSKYSASFKRDYIAGAAVVIFVLIVISEVVLAVTLPVYMKKENAMALSVRRLQLLETFDNLRLNARHLKSGNNTVQSEIKLLVWNLDKMADYLRQYTQYLSSDEIAILQSQLNEMGASLNFLSKQKPFSREYKIDYTPYLERIMKKSGVTE